MFGTRCYQIDIDKSKNDARHKYLQSLNEYQNIRKMWEGLKPNKFRFLRILFLLVPLLGIILAFGFSFIINGNNDSVDIANIIIYAFAFSIILYIIVFIITKSKNAIYHKKKSKIQNCERIVTIHDEKNAYYANENVFGYVVLDHIDTYQDNDGYTHHTNYYAYYEVDKGNIISIGYDSYFAEYVLQLRNPIYMDYSLEPTSEFRVQDVFDDTVLSNALSCSLPAKNIPF